MKLRLHLQLLLLPVLVFWASGCSPRKVPAPTTAPPKAEAPLTHYVRAHHGVVVSVSGPASDVGLSILKEGGNAVDAAVATAFALASAYPLAGNLGGGGFMLIHPAPGKGEPVVIDYREVAPAAASPTMFTREETQFSQRAVAVPGTVRGLALAHKRFGTLPWARLIAPAIAIARDGFAMDRNLVESANLTLAAAPDYAEFQHMYAKPGGGLWQVGDRLVQPDLARTLQTLADLGPDAFYTGPLADAILAEMSRGHGLITAKDLADYRAIERKPLTTRYRRQYDVYVPPPPSSGGVVLIEELNMLETFHFAPADRWSAKTIHVFAEIMRRANYDRARYLGDPVFAPLPPRLLTHEYAAERAKTIDLTKATPSASLSGDVPIITEGDSTTQFSIIDREGMAVANTYTLERRWGSRIVVRGSGYLLNNEMRAFNLFPGVTDTKGEVGTAPNLIAPGKRPLSSMTPTIVTKDGKVFLVTGSPGSRAIPHTILGIITGVIDFGMPVEQAVEAPRMTQEWFPDQITFETPERFPQVMQTLKQMGHSIVRTGPLPQGDAHTIWVERPGTYVGVADSRLNGQASGY